MLVEPQASICRAKSDARESADTRVWSWRVISCTTLVMNRSWVAVGMRRTKVEVEGK